MPPQGCDDLLRPRVLTLASQECHSITGRKEKRKKEREWQTDAQHIQYRELMRTEGLQPLPAKEPPTAGKIQTPKSHMPLCIFPRTVPF